MAARRPRPALAAGLYAAWGLLYLLHNDVWLWAPPPRLVAGLPAGLLFHVGLCFAASAVMALSVRFAWPRPAAVEPPA